MMHSLIVTAFLFFQSLSASINPEPKPFPAIDVKTLEGKTVNTRDYTNSGKITIVSFWATWCVPCKKELDIISEFYPEWVDRYNIQLLAITIDDARSITKVPALVKSKSWEFIVLADVRQELMQTLNIQAIPQTFLLDESGQIVYSHSGYNPGDELKLEEEISKLAKK
jgi:cytochrome c biogenesis protein CcmG/thiol:disulfide interchange protein DsbE